MTIEAIEENQQLMIKEISMLKLVNNYLLNVCKTLVLVNIKEINANRHNHKDMLKIYRKLAEFCGDKEIQPPPQIL